MKQIRRHYIAEVAFWLTLWLLLFRALWVDWAVNPQYSYGWLVPLLALGLFGKRWETRPPPSPPLRPHGRLIAAALLLILLFPTLLVAEANPEWRRTMWLQGGITVGVTLLLLGARGGTPWMRHFAFPVGFSLVAIPWPSTPEVAVIQELSRRVAGVVSGVLPWLGVPAVSQGNLIELAGGTVGVEEACSGIRSLQSTLMLALFFGEYYRLNGGRRGALVLIGFAAALLGNLGRTLFLTLQVAVHGNAGLDRWHDPAGYAASGLGFLLVWLAAWLMEGGGRTRLPRAPDARELSDARPQAATDAPSGARLNPAFFRTALLWLVLCLAGVEAWYRSHERRLVERPRWTMEWPAGSRPVELTERELRILRCDLHEGREWRDSQGAEWMVHHLGWSPGRASAQLARGHTPAGCFPAAGMRLVADLGRHQVRVGTVAFAFHQYRFDAQGRPVHAFWGLYEDKISPGKQPLRQDGSVASRLQAVLRGKRNLGQQVIEAALVNVADPETARQEFNRMLNSVLRPEGGPTGGSGS